MFGSDGTLAVAGVNETTRLRELNSPTQPVLVGELTRTGRPLAFAPDGHTLAVLRQDGSIGLRETEVRRVVATNRETTGTMLTPAVWDQYLPDLPYQPPCG